MRNALLKILFGLFTALSAGLLILLIIGAVISIMAGGGNVLLPGLGLVVSLPFLLIVLFVIEIALVTITIMLFRYISSRKFK